MEEETTEQSTGRKSIFEKIKKIDIYTWMIVVLLVLAANGIYADIMSISSATPASSIVQMLLLQLSVSVTIAAVTDMTIKFAKTKQLKLSKTGIITGLFVASILAEGTPLLIVAAAAFLAELLKHAIRYQNRNIFNPALLLLFVMSLVFKADLSWWASASLSGVLPFGIPLAVILGLFICWKYKRLSLVLPALLAYFIISFVLTGISNLSADTIVGYLLNNTLYYFVLLMLVEPKSSPVYRNSRIAYGITAAILLNVLPLFSSVSVAVAANAYPITILLSNLLGRVYEKLIK